MAELRPMRVGEILDAGLAVYRRHFGLLLQVGLVALWLPVAANVYVQVGGGQLAHPVLYIFANVLQYFGSLVLTASAVRIISDSYLGRAPQLGDAVTFAMSKVWPLFVVGFGYGLIVGLSAAVVGVVAAGHFAATPWWTYLGWEAEDAAIYAVCMMLNSAAVRGDTAWLVNRIAELVGGLSVS